MLQVNLPQAWLDELHATLQDLVSDKVASRISQQDFTLWGEPAESEAKIRLGWVNAAREAMLLLPELKILRDKLLNSGVDRIVLCGMGGSSLAPEVITKKHGVQLEILDSTSQNRLIR